MKKRTRPTFSLEFRHEAALLVVERGSTRTATIADQLQRLLS